MSPPSLGGPPSPLDFYTRRASELRSDADEGVRVAGSYRAGVFFLGLIGCAIFYESVITKMLPWWSFLLVIPIGLFLSLQAGRINTKALKLFRLCDYYGDGVSRLKRDWDSLDEGQEFIDPNHFYTTDLDVFGRGSLFQLLCSARTHAGRETLATWAKTPADREEVLARRTAISELRTRHDLREALVLAGSLKVSDCRPGTFRTWVAEPSSPFPSWGRGIAFLMMLSVFVPPALYWLKQIDLQTFWFCLVAILLVRAAFAAIFFRQVRAFEESVGPISVELPVIFEVMRIVLREKFSSEKLLAIANKTRNGEAPLRHLKRLIELYKERDNQVLSWPAYLLLWGTQFSMAIDQWRRREGGYLLEWLSALAEFEALLSLSTYSYEHPLDTFPEILEDGPALEAEGLGHPLLDEITCVRNDIFLGGGVQFLVISGSNMSGKSTFLRAIGLNAVLAWMGAPVRCTKFRISRLAIGAAIRVQDSLAEGRSHFLAEMQRLRRMIDVAGEKPLLYLADEIMSGTNSKDRRIATEWVVRALVLRKAVGVITTHDLALTEIANNGLPGRNMHFEDTGEGGQLHFDYTLRSGVLAHSNALNIAHMLGIDAAAIETTTTKKLDPDPSR